MRGELTSEEDHSHRHELESGQSAGSHIVRGLILLAPQPEPASAAVARPMSTIDDGSGTACAIRTSPIRTMPVPSGTLVKNCVVALPSVHCVRAAPWSA